MRTESLELGCWLGLGLGLMDGWLPPALCGAGGTRTMHESLPLSLLTPSLLNSPPPLSACRYKAALKSCPACPPEVRLGVAACCLKLGGTAKAELAYRRVLELSPDCIPALLGLAVLRLHTSSEDEGVREGSRLLAEAFERDSEVRLLWRRLCCC